MFPHWDGSLFAGIDESREPELDLILRYFVFAVEALNELEAELTDGGQLSAGSLWGMGGGVVGPGSGCETCDVLGEVETEFIDLRV